MKDEVSYDHGILKWIQLDGFEPSRDFPLWSYNRKVAQDVCPEQWQ